MGSWEYVHMGGVQTPSCTCVWVGRLLQSVYCGKAGSSVETVLVSRILKNVEMYVAVWT